MNKTILLFVREKNEDQYGYAVFGEITSGMDVVDKIAKVKTADKNDHQNVPVKPVVIKSIKKLGDKAKKKKD